MIVDEGTEASAGGAESEDGEQRLGDDSRVGRSQTLEGPASRCLPYSMSDEPLLPKEVGMENNFFF